MIYSPTIYRPDTAARRIRGGIYERNLRWTGQLQDARFAGDRQGDTVDASNADIPPSQSDSYPVSELVEGRE